MEAELLQTQGRLTTLQKLRVVIPYNANYGGIPPTPYIFLYTLNLYFGTVNKSIVSKPPNIIRLPLLPQAESFCKQREEVPPGLRYGF